MLQLSAGSKEMVRIARLKGVEKCPQINCLKHVPFEKYMHLLASARCMMGNSSAGIREAPAFGTPSINIGTRQACREHGSSVLDLQELSLPALLAAIEGHGSRRFAPDYRYGDGNATGSMVQHMKEVDVRATQKQFVDHAAPP